MNIKIKNNNLWIPAGTEESEAYINYKSRIQYYREEPITTNNLTVFRENNDVFMATYIKNNLTELVIPIIDFDDIKIFITDINIPDWLPVSNYQAWAYIDFIYDNKTKKKYITKNSSDFYYQVSTENIIEIDINDLSPNIFFSIGRNENNSIYLERNYNMLNLSRICDNEFARIGYRGFYNRITMDIDVIIIPPVNINSNKPPLPPNLIIEQTIIEDEQCILCCDYKKNIILNPCKHHIICSNCFNKMNNNYCPICKLEIENIISFL
jgi:hypothetical protein